MVRTKSAGHSELATTSEWVEKMERSRARSAEGRGLRQMNTLQSSNPFQNLEDRRHVPVDSLVLEFHSEVLLGCYLLSDGAQGTVENVLENCLKRTKRIAKT